MDLIIGGGITGLAYAAFTTNDYLLLESTSQLGGYCKTIKKNGYIWDYSGHFFHFQNKDIKDYVFNNINIKDIICIEKLTQIHHKGTMIDFPFQKNIHQLSKEEMIDCLFDLFNADKEEITSFKSMLYAKFGRTIADLFLIPYNEKLYACSLDKLEVEAMGRFFPYANKEEIISNFRKSDNSSYNGSFIYPRGGAEEYVKSVYANVDPTKVSLNEKLIRIDVKGKIAHTSKRSISYDNLISTIPFPQLLTACEVTFDPETYTSNQVLVFNMGFDKPGLRTNHWEYYADPGLSFYRVGYYSNIFGADKLSIYVEIGLRSNEGYDIDSLRSKVLDDLKRVGVITDHQLLADCVLVMNPAYVHMTDKMEKDKRKKMERLAKNNIYSIGRYGAWHYCSIEDNMLESISLSKKLANG